MTARQARYSEHMDVIFHRHARRFARSLEQRADVDVKPEIRKCRGNHLRSAIVTVLSHLGNQDSGTASFRFGEFLGQCKRLLEFRDPRGFRKNRRRRLSGLPPGIFQTPFQVRRKFLPASPASARLQSRVRADCLLRFPRTGSVPPAQHPPLPDRAPPWSVPVAATAIRAPPGCPRSERRAAFLRRAGIC